MVRFSSHLSANSSMSSLFSLMAASRSKSADDAVAHAEQRAVRALFAHDAVEHLAKQRQEEPTPCAILCAKPSRPIGAMRSSTDSA
jgi:hypothetical protein